MTTTPPSSARNSRRLERGLGFVWGFAEATVFFVVPDVWLTWIALHSVRNALVACSWALAGAVIGGIVVYLWGQNDLATALAVFDRLPSIGPALIERVTQQMQDYDTLALLMGGFSGVPYKLYAAQAAHAGMGLPVFIAATLLARGARFLVTTLVAGLLARWLAVRIGLGRVRLIWFGAVALNYALYWSLMPG